MQTLLKFPGPCDCGGGGWRSNPNDPHPLPFHVDLTDPGSNPFCSGTMITEVHVLTSASCLRGRTLGSFVVTEASNIGHNLVDYHEVQSMRVHPDYDPLKGRANDLAILKLSRPIDKIDSRKLPECLSPDSSFPMPESDLFMITPGLDKTSGNLTSEQRSLAVTQCFEGPSSNTLSCRSDDSRAGDYALSGGS